MTLPVHLDQLCRVDVRVALSGAQPRVAQQFLNGAEISAAL
jgi:hypothetical protein